MVHTPIVVPGIPGHYVTYWGYNPHAHGETGVDNTVAGTTGTSNTNNITSQGTTNLTNEGPQDGGIPLDQALPFILSLAGLNFTQLGLINVASGTDTGKGTVSTSTQTFPTGMTITGGGSGTTTITVTYSDGTNATAEVAISQQYFNFLHDALFDAQGNTRLYQHWVDAVAATTSGVTTTLQPIKLTTAVNNGGTLENTGGILDNNFYPTTTQGNDTIVAGRLELLQQAYIDGGAGYNILEVDAKGSYAQPAQLLNIQEVRVNDLPNFYTTGA